MNPLLSVALLWAIPAMAQSTQMEAPQSLCRRLWMAIDPDTIDRGMSPGWAPMRSGDGFECVGMAALGAKDEYGNESEALVYAAGSPTSIGFVAVGMVIRKRDVRQEALRKYVAAARVALQRFSLAEPKELSDLLLNAPDAETLWPVVHSMTGEWSVEFRRSSGFRDPVPETFELLMSWDSWVPDPLTDMDSQPSDCVTRGL